MWVTSLQAITDVLWISMQTACWCFCRTQSYDEQVEAAEARLVRLLRRRLEQINNEQDIRTKTETTTHAEVKKEAKLDRKVKKHGDMKTEDDIKAKKNYITVQKEVKKEHKFDKRPQTADELIRLLHHLQQPNKYNGDKVKNNFGQYLLTV